MGEAREEIERSRSRLRRAAPLVGRPPYVLGICDCDMIHYGHWPVSLGIPTRARSRSVKFAKSSMFKKLIGPFSFI